MSSAATEDATKAPAKVCAAVQKNEGRGNILMMQLAIVDDLVRPHPDMCCAFFIFPFKEGGSAPEQNKRSPSDFLKAVLGRPVNVRLSSGTDYRGKQYQRLPWMNTSRLFLTVCYFVCSAFIVGVLACLDGYMNIAMEQTEEYVDGQLTSKYGDCFIRGNNGKQCLSERNFSINL